MKIAIDAMGGDYAPMEIVKGVEIARDRYPDIEFLLFGTSEQVKPLVKDWSHITLIPTTEVIEMLSLIHISEPTRRLMASRMPSSA